MKKEPANNHLQLELHVPDFGPVKEYYGRLGFEIGEFLKKYPAGNT